MMRRPRMATVASMPLTSSLGAILAALVVAGVFLLARGHDPVAAYRILVERGLLDGDGLTETLKKMAPLLMVSAGLTVALRAGIWNIGIDGQFLVGALAAGVTGATLVGQVPAPLMWGVAALTGVVGGVAWAVVPALLRVRFGLNEIISTLMMNYVALNVTAWLAKGPVKDPDLVAPQTQLIPRADWLPNIPGTDIHIGLVAALVTVAAVAVLFARTVPGFMLSVLGRSKRAAIHVGYPVGKLTVAALLASGGLAGLAGANDVLGVQGLFKANWNPGYGFMAFALVYLARLRAAWLVPFAFFFSFLLIGGESMPRRAGIPTSIVAVLVGLMLLFFAVAVVNEQRRRPVALVDAADVVVPEVVA